MLDNQHSIAIVHHPVQHVQKKLDVGEVQPGGWFIEQVERLSGTAFHQFACQFDSLGFSAGQGRRRLAKLHIIETDLVQCLQLVTNFGNILKYLHCLLYVHFQHIGDGMPFKFHLQRFAIETVFLTHRTTDPNVSQKVHFKARGTVSFARFTAAAFYVKAKPPRFVPAPLRLRQLGEQRTDLVKYFRIGSRIRAGCATDGRLVNGNQFVQLIQTVNLLMFTRIALAVV